LFDTLTPSSSSSSLTPSNTTTTAAAAATPPFCNIHGQVRQVVDDEPSSNSNNNNNSTSTTRLVIDVDFEYSSSAAALPSDWVGLYPCDDALLDPPFSKEPPVWAYTCYDRNCRKDPLIVIKSSSASSSSSTTTTGSFTLDDATLPPFTTQGIYQTIHQTITEQPGCYILLLNRIEGDSAPPYYNICQGNRMHLDYNTTDDHTVEQVVPVLATEKITFFSYGMLSEEELHELESTVATVIHRRTSRRHHYHHPTSSNIDNDSTQSSSMNDDDDDIIVTGVHVLFQTSSMEEEEGQHANNKDRIISATTSSFSSYDTTDDGILIDQQHAQLVVPPPLISIDLELLIQGQVNNAILTTTTTTATARGNNNNNNKEPDDAPDEKLVSLLFARRVEQILREEMVTLQTELEDEHGIHVVLYLLNNK